MPTCILYNPKAGSAEQVDALRGRLKGRADITLQAASTDDEAACLIAETLSAGCDRVVAAGGDGTIHQVVNALAPDFARASLGIIPLGTGNDLSRTLAIPLDPLDALAVLDSGPVRSIDLIEIETSGRRLYGANVAAGGLAGQLEQTMTREMKDFWGGLAYLRGAASVAIELQNYDLTVRFDGGPAEQLEVVNVTVANGRTAGAGLQVAPRANPEDGWLDVVAVRNGSPLDLAYTGTRLLAGDYLDPELTSWRRARRVEIASDPAMPFSVDGELIQEGPITFRVRPHAIRVVVGPEYKPESD